MDKTIAEKRQFLRIPATLPIRITPEFLGETVDLSETGLRFMLQKPLFLFKAQAQIELSPEESIDTEFRVIWNKHLVQEGKFIYGACFIGLKERDLSNLRYILIKSHLDQILSKVDNVKDKEKIRDFWCIDFKSYMDRLPTISNMLEQGFNRDEAFKQVFDFNETIMKKGDELESSIDNRIVMKKIKKTFRELCGPWVYKSDIVKHALEKPRGYPGDYKLLEIIYNNQTISYGIGFCYDKYFLNNPYSIAVRNRKEKMSEILKEFIEYLPFSHKKILNLACGSCREIKKLFDGDGFIRDKEVVFTLVDQDEKALEFSREILRNNPKNVSFKFLQHNILDYIKEGRKNSKLLGRQNMIYSIGLADYLPDRVLKNLLLFCFNLLEPKGKLVIAHKDVNKYKPLPPDWWCDWTFYPRDENYLLNLVTKSGIENFSLRLTREPSEIILFLEVERA